MNQVGETGLQNFGLGETALSPTQPLLRGEETRLIYLCYQPAEAAFFLREEAVELGLVQFRWARSPRAQHFNGPFPQPG